MFKNKILQSFLALLFGMCLFYGGKIQADYAITNYDVNVNLQQDGSADITQQITYNFKGTSRGVYYDQPLEKGVVATQPSIVVQENGQSIQLTPNHDGSNNSFQVIETDDALKLKLFHNTADTTTTYYYSYHVTNFVKNWQDTAELNWTIIGNKWNVPLNNVRLKFQLPSTNVADLKAWTRSESKATTSVSKEKGSVVVNLKQNPSASQVKTRLLFPTSVVSTNGLVVNQKHKQAAIKSEQAWLKDNTQTKKVSNRNNLIFKAGVFGLALVIILVWALYLLSHPVKKQKWPDVNPPHSYEIPPMSAPVAMSIYTDNVPDNNALGAYLLELAVKQKIAIEEFNTKRKDYQLTLLDASLANSEPMIDFLFNTVGDGKKVTLHELRKYGKTQRESKQMSHIYDKWKNQVEQEALSYDYLSKKSAGNFYLTVFLCGISCLLLLWTLFLWKTPWMTGLSLVLILGQVGFNVYHFRKHSPYTETGVELITQLRAFRHTLKDLNKINLKSKGDLTYWSQVLPYAIAFGYNKRVINALQANFTVKELEDGLGFYYNLLFTAPIDFGDSFSTSVTRALGNYHPNNN
ncbi:hypothetical protein FC14_GL000396 [Ligilactobacillus agilis DSM 20509]|uniref:DUF2207 domain-containing protein n=1 Tax=Ligilactobacillus agilis DSM 20509 TaxID=1423718 RepID=A0A0R2AGT6_9LACO|nr:DUF2207 domain-containing protein [Ligilactobacillus agilis]KRM63611.1 hypothetical protein FC14_GL000396 [Ligilactobacillus agilis DSM 20509]